MRRVDASTLRSWIGDGAELAILDAREEGEFGASHLFWAVSCPLSAWELRAPALLPWLGTRIICVDDGCGLAERLAAGLEAIGATDVAVLQGGTMAWADAGGVLFSGVNVPSKAFGEWVEHHYATPSVDAPELKAWIDAGRDMVVLDSRPMDEFHAMSIPHGLNVPGGELVYRIAELAPRPDTLIVVNCAGRTRSILGAESLRRTGVPNEVVALRNGTMGWNLAGLACDTGRTARYAPGLPPGADLALARATAFAEQSGVQMIDADEMARLAGNGGQTCYVLDVRDPVEFAAGQRPGSRNAPGGQLVQATDRWIAVRGANVFLIDDTGVRARMTAAWLRQMGHPNVYAVSGALEDAASENGTVSPGTISPRQLADADLPVVDLARSTVFRAGHIPRARWGIRTRLAALGPALRGAGRIVVTSPDGVLAALAVTELAGITGAPVEVLTGGTAAWRAAGLPLEADRTVPTDAECVDSYLRPYDRNEGVAEAMRAYLSWEIDLVREIERDGTVRFGL